MLTSCCCRRKRLQIEISENAMLKVDEIQKPIIGGSWTTKTDFGRLEIKIVPYWTGEFDEQLLVFGKTRAACSRLFLSGREAWSERTR